MDIEGIETGKFIVGYCPTCEVHYQKRTVDGSEHTCRVVETLDGEDED